MRPFITPIFKPTKPPRIPHPARVETYSRWNSPTRERLVADVAAYLSGRELTAAEGACILAAKKSPDSFAKDDILRIAAPFYRADVIEMMESMKDSSASASRLYAKVAKDSHQTDSPAELRFRYLAMRRLIEQEREISSE